MKRLLVANRGEIVRRIHRTAKQLGIETAVVYSAPDANLPYLSEVDCATRLPGTNLADTYLSIENVLSAAERVHADAIHPGYGFLAENADFCEAVIKRGLTFVGPDPEVMRKLGRKDLARKLAAQVGVPVIPGYDGELQDQETLTEEASRVGFPLLIKAVAGGGGRGVREVFEQSAFLAALDSAKREAVIAFGDDRVVLERLIRRARHVEVQLLGDNHGNIVHLFERDCTYQRRKQKLIEEAPAPFLDHQTRAQILSAAVELGRSAKLTNATTVEFLVTEEGEPFFIEANTRLQVEHGVTEMITGVDIVELQLRIARNETLPIKQSDISSHGHAIQARVCAEVPERDFIPATGTIRFVALPQTSEARLEHALAPGVVVSGEFDSLLLKALVHAPERAAAAIKLGAVLDEAGIVGVETNTAFLEGLLRSLAFAEGSYSIDSIAAEKVSGRTKTESAHSLSELYRDSAIIFSLLRIAGGENELYFGDPFVQMENNQLRVDVRARHPALHYDGIVQVQLERFNRHERRGSVVADGKRLDVHLESSSTVAIDGTKRVASFLASGPLSSDRTVVHLSLSGHALILEPHHPDVDQLSEKIGNATGEVISPLPATVLQIHVKHGALVKMGETLVVLESMKMEHTVAAPINGSIETLYVKKGDKVKDGQPLLKISQK